MAECVFCAIAAGESPAWVFYEHEAVIGILNLNPVSRYHVLVIPRRHADSLLEIEEADWLAVAQATRRIARAMREKLGIEHIQLITNAGREAQQSVFHLHMHLVPRRRGDNLDIIWHAHPEWRPQFDQWKNDLTEALR